MGSAASDKSYVQPEVSEVEAVEYQALQVLGVFADCRSGLELLKSLWFVRRKKAVSKLVQKFELLKTFIPYPILLGPYSCTFPARLLPFRNRFLGSRSCPESLDTSSCGTGSSGCLLSPAICSSRGSLWPPAALRAAFAREPGSGGCIRHCYLSMISFFRLPPKYDRAVW